MRLHRTVFFGAATALALVVATKGQQAFAADYFNGFETDTSGWDVGGGQYNATRVPSGTDGITAATGSFFAELSQNDLDNNGGSGFTRYGGYESSFGNGYSTSLDIFLNVGGSWANDTRLDWDNAINDNTGGFHRDFVFNGGFYNNTDATGSGSRFVFTASNNAGRGGSNPENPGRDPFAITNTGWYTFTNNFYNNGGVLADDLSILDSSSNLLHTWTLSDPSDLIAGIGGNRYGWMASNEFSTLGIDNSRKTDAVPEPASLAALGLGGLALIRRRRQSKA